METDGRKGNCLMILIEDKWSEKFKSFAKLLKEQKQENEIEGEKKKSFCKICGKCGVQLFYDNNKPICKFCKNSRVTNLHDTTTLLYLTYGNFRQIFDIKFQRPQLFFLTDCVQNIYELDDKRDNYTGLVTNITQVGYDFTIGIVKDVPYAFLEELFAFSFARQYLKEKIIDWKKIQKHLNNTELFEWNDNYKNSEILMEKIQNILNNGKKLNEKAKCEKAILICYLYYVGREEQADILKQRMFNFHIYA